MKSSKLNMLTMPEDHNKLYNIIEDNIHLVSFPFFRILAARIKTILRRGPKLYTYEKT